MVLAGGQFQPVKGAIDEGGNGRFKGEPQKAVSAGIKGKELLSSTNRSKFLEFIQDVAVFLLQFLVSCPHSVQLPLTVLHVNTDTSTKP